MANENEEFDLQPRPFPKDMVADIESNTVAHQIRDYLWGKGPVDYENVSGSLDRRLVLRFVDFELQDLPPDKYWRARILADLYALRELLPTFVRGVDGDVNSETIERAIVSTIILREIGDAQMIEKAGRSYDRLVGHPDAGDKIEELLQCLAAFGNEKTDETLKKRIDAEASSLTSREASEPEAGVERRFLEDLANNELFFIHESNRSKARIDRIQPDSARLEELIRAYLTLTDDDGAEYFQLWTHQQIRRHAEKSGRDGVIDAFRKIFGEVKSLPGADLKFCRIRTLNAIEFFGGVLGDDDKVFLDKNRVKQLDPLHLITVPQHIDEPEEIVEEEIDAEEAENDEESN